MIASMQQEKHDRARTEIEGNVLSHFRAGMAVHLQFLKTPPLDLAHANDHAAQAPLKALRIRPKHAIENLGQILQVRDVVDFGTLRRHGLSLYNGEIA
jgi:hypothetical protein